jgi:predicted nicotinamide N-methyase
MAEIVQTKRFSVWNNHESKNEVKQISLAAALAARQTKSLSTNWQREVGFVPQSAYSEKKYSLTFKNGKVLSVPEAHEQIGSRVWDCAPMMSRWFEKGDFVRGKKVLELGSGTGFLGFACAMLGAAKVVITDIATLLTTMEKNIEYTNLSDICTARVLDWNDIDAVIKLKQEFGGFDMIVASDVLVFTVDATTDGESGFIRSLRTLSDPTTEILMGCNKNRHGFLVGFYAHPPHKFFDIHVVDKSEVDPDYYTDMVMLYRMWRKA